MNQPDIQEPPSRANGLWLLLAATVFCSAALVTGIFWAISALGSGDTAESRTAQALQAALAQTENQWNRGWLPAEASLYQWAEYFSSGLSTEEAGRAAAVMAWMKRTPPVRALQLRDTQGNPWALTRDEGGFHVLSGKAWTHHTPSTAKSSAPRGWNARDAERLLLDLSREDVSSAGLKIRPLRGASGLFSAIHLILPFDAPSGKGIAALTLSLEDALLPADIPDIDAVALLTGDAALAVATASPGQEDHSLEAPLEQAFSEALTQWESAGSPPMLLASGQWSQWWYAFRPIDGAAPFWIGVRLNPASNAWPWALPAMAALALAILLAAATALLLGRAYTRPLAALTRRLQSLESLESAQHEWPNTRIRELRQLTEACKAITRQFDRRIRQLARVQTIEHNPQASREHASQVGALARAFVSRLEEERSTETEEPVKAPPEPPKQEAPPPAQNGDYDAPPQAFVQAMQSTRRQLSGAEKKLAALNQQCEILGDKMRLQEQRLYAQRKVLGMLVRDASGSVQDGADPFARLLENAARTMNVSGAGIWLAGGHGEFLSCAARYDRAGQRHSAGGELRRSEFPVFFIAAESQDVIRVRDAASDPRAPQLPPFDEDALRPEALLITPVFSAGGLAAAMIYEHTGGPRTWTIDEENFAIALAQFAAHRLTREARPAPSATAGPDAGALSALDMHEETPLYRWMLDSAGWIVWALNESGAITYANIAAEEAYGRDAMEMLGRAISDFASEGARHADLEALRRVMGGEEACVYETEHLGADGQPMRLRVTLTLLQDETGAELGAVGVAEDVTEVRRKERALRDRMTHFQDLVEHAPQIIWSADAIGCITSINPAAERIYGFPAKELIGRPITQLSYEDHGQRDLDRLYRLLAGVPCTGYRTLHRTRDGQALPMLILGEARRDENGRVNGALGLAIVVSVDEDPAETKEEAPPENAGEADPDKGDES